MKRYFKKKFIWGLIPVALLLYLFWGPLFPWSPVKPGFKKIRTPLATVFVEGQEDQATAADIERILKEEEMFHGLNFRKKFRIVILGKDRNMKRFLPWLGGSAYSVSLSFANLVYLGPNSSRSPYGREVYLRHELSHLLIGQNISSYKEKLIAARQGWLTEGIATYYAGPQFYTKDEFISRWKEEGLSFDRLYEQDPLSMDASILRLKYAYYGFFIGFLVETYGLDRVQEYLKRFTDAPELYQSHFPLIFHKELKEIMKEFDHFMTDSSDYHG